ncbi:glycerate kinase [Corynebacterium breve]|uniref:Glycerate kinase n=2 Tax=Corynebacterium breve TaxID=3049799 RepID=A0ABY8VF78_9CORY|nr:glycerate kinase [Corynebacterium breve]WIM66918.1 glycerate kinase [Corynebacterium breve]
MTTPSASASSPIDDLNHSDVRVVIAPDSFKGTASAEEAAQWLGEGVRQVIANAQIQLAPMADGGEGTSAKFEGERITLPTTDAAGRLTEATYTFNAETETAYIEDAAASGLPAVADKPCAATGDTYGTGVLIADAETRGARRIVLGLGGSATVDGGTGILVALGVNPLNKEGYTLRPGGAALTDLDDFDLAKANIPAGAVDWILLTDVDSPVTGPHGAAHVFGPQKGATAEDIEQLDRGLARLCEVTGIDPETPRYGAAGAIPVGLVWLSTTLHGNDDHIQVLSGAEVLAASMGLPKLINNASLVITGEGAYDEQTASGKVVNTVMSLADDSPAVVAVAAGKIAADLPASVIGTELSSLSEAGSVAEQLRRAGAQIAVDYLRISTVQG